MKIAAYQLPGTRLDIEANLASIAQQAGRAAQQSAQLLIAPEMILSGYNIGPEAIIALAQAADGVAAAAIADIARKHQIAILYGYPEAADGKVFNSVQMIDSSGERLGNYRKTHLFGAIDNDVFSPGSDATVLVDLDGWRIGLLICYDVEFPENVRRLALAGADLVAVPTAVMVPYDFVSTHMVPTRAFENGIFVAYVNRCATENGLQYIGQSCIVGPDGRDLARAAFDEDLIFAELDTELLRQWRKTNTYMNDRRPALYSPLSETLD